MGDNSSSEKPVKAKVSLLGQLSPNYGHDENGMWNGKPSASVFCLICASHKSYDEPEILSSSSHPICLRSAAAGQEKHFDQGSLVITTVRTTWEDGGCHSTN